MDHRSVTPNSWYSSEEAAELLAKTNDGMFCFLWEAEHDDGSIVRQFDDVVFQRALSDPNFKIPPEDYVRRSVDILDRSRIKRFALIPTASFRKTGVRTSYDVEPDLKAGERFVSYWLTDRSERTGITLRRTVIGIEDSEGRKFLKVLSPSGASKNCSDDDNQSFEGE